MCVSVCMSNIYIYIYRNECMSNVSMYISGVYIYRSS